MTSFQVLIAVLLAIGGLIVFLLKKRQKYWSGYNVPTAPESFFFFRRRMHVAKYFQNIYNRFCRSGEKFVGCFVSLSPSALIIDLELIRHVLIRDFENFPDRGMYYNIRDDPLSLNLLRLEGEPWRRLRTKLTPTFTSGKIKFMFPTKVIIGDRLVTTVEGLVKQGKRELDVRELSAGFTTDIIGSVAFGIECNSLGNPHTEFRLHGEKAFKCFRPILEELASAYPNFFRRLRMTSFPQDLIKFYSQIVRETFEQREKQQIIRNDFIDILRELRSSQRKDGEPILTMEEIIGQVFGFFIAGYETSSSTMTYCLYELSKNQDIQEKARTDVVNALQRYDNELSYDCLKEMQYLAQVVQETLRMHPVGPILRRIVRKRYLIPDTSIYLEKGVHALIPIYAIHHDPMYYPEPEKFDPDRFSPKEYQKRHPMCYLPFGAGPRSCIAERFGKIEVILGIALLLKNFKFTPSERTPTEVQYDITQTRILKMPNLFLNVEKLK